MSTVHEILCKLSLEGDVSLSKLTLWDFANCTSVQLCYNLAVYTKKMGPIIQSLLGVSLVPGFLIALTVLSNFI